MVQHPGTPDYAFPERLEDVPSRLRKRMQGKSCSSFTRLDDGIVAELGELTAEGLDRYRLEGLL